MGAAVRQGVAQIGRTHKPGGKMVFVVFDIGGQCIEDAGAMFFLCQSKMQREHTARLGLADDAPARGIVFLPERGQRFVAQRRVLFGLSVLTQHPGGFGYQAGNINIVSVGNQVNIGSTYAAFTPLPVQSQPVAVLIVRHPQAVFVGMGCDVVHPLVHAGPVFFQNAPVTVGAPHDPGDDNGGVAPCGGTEGSLNIRHDVRHAVFQRGGSGHVTHPFGKKECSLPIESRRPREDLGIPHPA